MRETVDEKSFSFLQEDDEIFDKEVPVGKSVTLFPCAPRSSTKMRKIGHSANYSSAWRFLVCFQFFTALSLCRAFVPTQWQHPSTQAPPQNLLSLSRQASSTTTSTSEATATATASASAWVKHGIFISSFTDGILTSPEARSFLKYSVACSLLSEKVRAAEARLRESVMASPCNGPNMEAFTTLEAYDQMSGNHNDNNNHADDTNSSRNKYSEASANQLLQELATQQSTTTHDNNETSSTSFVVRLLYIPTAMYALNPSSANTPGKQRQRARADGKKRRTVVAQHLQDLLQPHLSDVKVLAITLDLEDGSLKQAVGSDHASDFPKDGVESLTTWAPHVVYVEGGNTFWLQHCLEQGDWAAHILNACTGPEATSVYIGKSAGAIVAGATVETATWKGWDDPSVVPGRETYEDWQGCPGLAMVDQASFFPHMSADWESLVKQKQHDMKDEERSKRIVCLQECDAYCVDGTSLTAMMVSGEPSTATK